MCLQVQDLESRRLAQGEHLGFEFEIVHNDMGYRCGYLRVLPGHPWFGKGYDGIEAEVHGGLTYADAGTACDTHGEEGEWWIGFDCAHLGDAQDLNLPATYRRPNFGSGVLRETVKDTDYVKRECFSLAEQARAAAEG